MRYHCNYLGGERVVGDYPGGRAPLRVGEGVDHAAVQDPQQVVGVHVQVHRVLQVLRAASPTGEGREAREAPLEDVELAEGEGHSGAEPWRHHEHVLSPTLKPTRAESAQLLDHQCYHIQRVSFGCSVHWLSPYLLHRI